MENSVESRPLLRRERWIGRLIGGGWHYQTAELLKKQSKQLKESKLSHALEGHDLLEVLEELESKGHESGRNMLLGFLGILLHIGVGIGSMVYLEGWHPRDAAYFCIVTITTVGYGDLSPSSHKSKLFVMAYVIVSIVLVASYLSYFVGKFLDEQEHMLFAKSVEKKENQLGALISGDLDAKILHATEQYDWDDFYHLVFSTILLLLVFCVGIFTFMTFEQLPFIDALYLIVISASTVGFGDQHPQHPISRYTMTVWLIFATISLANLIGEITRFRMKAKQRSLTRRVLTVPIDKRSLEKLDQSHNGTVSWGEFLSSIIVSTGQMEQREIDLIRLRFQELNPDKNDLVQISRFRDIELE